MQQMSRKDHRSRCLGEISVFIPHGESEAPKKPDGHQLQACPDRADRDFFLKGSLDLAIVGTLLALKYFSCALETRCYPGLYSSKPAGFRTTFNPATCIAPSPLCHPKSRSWLGRCCKAKKAKIIIKK